MSKLEALKELLAKVESGSNVPFGSMSTEAIDHFSQMFITLAERSCKGSLDAAEKLHDAVLPYFDWDFEQFGLNGELILKRGKPLERVYGFADMDPARAWLICILKALIAKEQEA